MTERTRLRIAAAMGATGVAAGAFGAHLLKELVTAERLVTWETGARYHLVHAVVLLVLALTPARTHRSFELLLAGSCVFAGSLYLLVLLDLPILGAVTPIGGVLLISGWVTLGLSAAKPGPR